MSTQIPLSDIQPSPTNPRARMDDAALAELVESVRTFGVLSPVLLREAPVAVKGSKSARRKYEIVYGHRRFAAAVGAGLDEIPADVRELTDEQALEIQLVENRDREDVHPLDEAEAYQRFHQQFGHSAEDIAARVGRPIQFVKDRLRLMQLVEEAKEHFLEGRIHLGHAIILARLKPDDQKRAIKAGLFQEENLLYHPDDESDEDPIKVRTVRELQGWVDSHVKLDVKAPIVADLFPETHAAIEQVGGNPKQLLPITHESYLPPDAKDGERVYTPQSWRRADGNHKSKTCDKSVLGIVMVGPGRGESFHVCINRTACKVHFAEEIKAAAARAKHGSASKSAGKATARASNTQNKYDIQNKLNEANRQAFNASAPAIVAAIIKQLGKLEVKPNGKLADLLVQQCLEYGDKPTAHMARGKDAKSLLRYLVLQALETEMGEWASFREFPKLAKNLGFKLDGVFPKPITKLPAEAKGAKSAPVADDEDDE